jgi:hypothetical protein
MAEELWLMHASSPVKWTVPFYVVTRKGKAEREIFYAVNLMPYHKKIVDAFVTNHARPYNGMWMILLPDLMEIAYQVEGPNPDELFSWEQKRMPYKDENEAERRKSMDEFLDGLYQKGFGTRQEIECWWAVFCNHALDWMLNKNKPVDMGFIKLHALYYRSDWMDGVYYKLWANYFVFKKFYVARRARQLWRETLVGRFFDGRLLAIRPDGRHLRTVNVEYKQSWRDSMLGVEAIRKQHLGEGYEDYVKADILKKAKTAFRLFRTWTVDSLEACGRASTGRSQRLGRTSLFRTPLSSRYEWIQDFPVPELESAYKKPGGSKPVPQKDVGLPGV